MRAADVGLALWRFPSLGRRVRRRSCNRDSRSEPGPRPRRGVRLGWWALGRVRASGRKPKGRGDRAPGGTWGDRAGQAEAPWPRGREAGGRALRGGGSGALAGSGPRRRRRPAGGGGVDASRAGRDGGSTWTREPSPEASEPEGPRLARSPTLGSRAGAVPDGVMLLSTFPLAQPKAASSGPSQRRLS